MVRVDPLPRPVPDADVAALAEVLRDCVEDGASVGFRHGLSQRDAVAWWRRRLEDDRLLSWVARDDEGVVLGTVSLHLDQPDTGQHRGEVTKLLVRASSRRDGVASALMSRLEADAVAHGRSLLMLDTESGSAAEHLYLRLGWEPFGRLEGHAEAPDGRLTPTTFLAKRLAPRG